jgi:hypothetical protein
MCSVLHVASHDKSGSRVSRHAVQLVMTELAKAEWPLAVGRQAMRGGDLLRHVLACAIDPSHLHGQAGGDHRTGAMLVIVGATTKAGAQQTLDCHAAPRQSTADTRAGAKQTAF